MTLKERLEKIVLDETLTKEQRGEQLAEIAGQYFEEN
jgi:hypothetical protein